VLTRRVAPSRGSRQRKDAGRGHPNPFTQPHVIQLEILIVGCGVQEDAARSLLTSSWSRARIRADTKQGLKFTISGPFFIGSVVGVG
jgi:hypothetical protein